MAYNPKLGVPQVQVPFELGQILGLLLSVRNMLKICGLDEDAEALAKISRAVMLQVNTTMPKLAPTFVPYAVE